MRMSHIQLYLAFMLFWSIFMEYDKKQLILLKKKSFSQQNEPHPAKLSISTVWSISTDIG